VFKLNSKTYSHVFCVIIKNILNSLEKRKGLFVLTQNRIWKSRRHVEWQRGDSIIRQVFWRDSKIPNFYQCIFLSCRNDKNTSTILFHVILFFDQTWLTLSARRTWPIWWKYTKNDFLCQLDFCRFLIVSQEKKCTFFDYLNFCFLTSFQNKSASIDILALEFHKRNFQEASIF